MCQQILAYSLAVSIAIAGLVYKSTLVMNVFIPTIVRFAIGALASAAVATTAFPVNRQRETLGWQNRATLWTSLHTPTFALQCANCIALCYKPRKFFLQQHAMIGHVRRHIANKGIVREQERLLDPQAGTQ